MRSRLWASHPLPNLRWWALLAGLLAAAPAPAAQQPAPTTACADEAADCKAWARLGQCEANPRYMKVKCSASCDTCDWAVFEERCALDPAAISAVAPGDMEAMFSRLTTSAAYASYKPYVVSRDPYVVVLDEFMSADEADAIVDIAQRDGGKHFVSSESSAGTQGKGEIKPVVSQHRTSSTQWCADGCWNESAVARIRERVAAITGVPISHAEAPQLLKYHPGQAFQMHHDYIPLQKGLPCGPRVYTFFLYLSDVEEGGHTHFQRLGVAVRPKKGRAVLWPSTLNEAPDEIDMRTVHSAEAVLRGVKISANIWVHTHNYLAARDRTCVGSVPPAPPSPEQ